MTVITGGSVEQLARHAPMKLAEEVGRRTPTLRLKRLHWSLLPPRVCFDPSSRLLRLMLPKL